MKGVRVHSKANKLGCNSFWLRRLLRQSCRQPITHSKCMSQSSSDFVPVTWALTYRSQNKEGQMPRSRLCYRTKTLRVRAQSFLKAKHAFPLFQEEAPSLLFKVKSKPALCSGETPSFYVSRFLALQIALKRSLGTKGVSVSLPRCK